MLLWVFEGDAALDCSGAVVVVAFDFEEAKKLVAQAWDEASQPYTGSASRFFLKETIPVYDIETPRVVLVSWTW